MSDERERVRQNLVGKDLFESLVDLEVEKATRLQYCVSVVCLTPDVPVEKTDPAVTKHLAAVATRSVRATDVVTTLSPSSIGLLLIDAGTHDLPRIFRRTTAELFGRPLAAGAGEERATWSAGGSCYPLTATNGNELLRQASDLLSRAQQEGGGRLCLPG